MAERKSVHRKTVYIKVARDVMNISMVLPDIYIQFTELKPKVQQHS